MVTPVTYYEDSSQTEAHVAELALWFGRTSDINDASARKLAERIAGSQADARELADLIGAVHA